MTRESTYPIAPKGLATNFAQSEAPIEFARKLTNRFINQNGSAEKRQGLQILDTIAGASLTGIHEFIDSDGSPTLYASGRGRIFKFDGSVFSQVHSVASTNKLRSDQMGERLIFYNAENRDFFTSDSSAFSELKAIIEQGEVTAASATGFTDPDIVNWITGTNVAVNDIVFNITLNASGVITAVASAAITHTAISSAGDGLGVASRDPESGDRYEVIDMVELNIIPTDGQDDNVAVATSGTSETVIAVSGVDFSTTEIRVEDFLRNTVRAAVTQVTSVSANLSVVAISGQISGDSIVFLKSAMPISSYSQVHYGRRYSVDSRDRRKIRISGANDPTDMTEDAGTLDAITFSFGTQQPEGNSVVSLDSFQNTLVMAGSKAVLTFSGTNPIGSDTDFVPVALFPHGVASPDAIAGIGNDATFLSFDGLQSLQQSGDASSLNRANLSEQIRNVLRDRIEGASEANIIVRHYPRRSWVICKIGSECYIYNYGAVFTSRGFQDRFGTTGSWALFDGLFANQAEYFTRSDGDLITVDSTGKVYLFDQNIFSDDGAEIPTTYQTNWLSTEEPNRFVGRKAGKYIKPIYEASQQITYTVTADADYDKINVDQITVTSSGQSQAIGQFVIGTDEIGATGIANLKYPLRWNGEVVRLNFQTTDILGPDLLNSFTLYSAIHGRR